MKKTAARELKSIEEKIDTLLCVFKSSSSSANTMMEARSRLGYTLHACCIVNAKFTFNYIVSIMEKEPYSSKLSIVLVASASFALKYIDFADKEALTQWSIAPFLRHTAFDDDDHLAHFTQFLQSGGASLVPCLESIVNDLLLKAEVGNKDVSKPISLLISTSPRQLSEHFWSWAKHHPVDSHLISIIGGISVYSDLIPPGDQAFLQSIETFCRKQLATDSESFLAIEPCLQVMKWMVKVHCSTCDGILPIYRNDTLNALAIQIWTEYAKYGNLEQIPLFNESRSKQILNAQAQLIANAATNPNFSIDKFKTNHWLWDAIISEFSVSNSEYKEIRSLLEMSIVELDAAISLANRLPHWMFVHALRCRTNNTDFLERVCSLVGHIPSVILKCYINEFFEFVEYVIQFPLVVPSLRACIRSLYPILEPHLRTLSLRLIRSLDYFAEGDFCCKLSLINTIAQFSKDRSDLLAVFDTIWESFAFMDLSLNMCKALFAFFNEMCLAEITCRPELVLMASATLYAMLGCDEPSFIERSPKAHLIYTKCCKFYSIVSSDLVFYPLYTIEETFPLTPVSLLILKNLQPEVEDNSIFLVKVLYRILPICPIETIAVANNYLQFAINHGLKKYVSVFCTSVREVLQRYSNASFVMLASLFQKKVMRFVECDFSALLHSNMTEFSDDIDYTRVTLQTNSVLMPLLLTKKRQLSLLYENWAPVPDTPIMGVIATSVSDTTSWQEEKIVRQFIGFFSPGLLTAPENKSTWLYRDFVKDPFAAKLTPTKETDMTTFKTMYPVIPQDSDAKSLLFLCKHYEKCVKPLRKLIQSNVDACITACVSPFWFMRLLIRLGIPYTIPDKDWDEQVTALMVRQGKKLKHDGVGEYLCERLLYCSQNNLEEEKLQLLKTANSKYLSVKYLSKGVPPDAAMFDTKLSSIWRSLLFKMSIMHSHDDFLNHLEPIVCSYLKKLDGSNPLLFREALLFVVSLVMSGSRNINLAAFCDAFLRGMAKNAKISSSRLYQSLLQLPSIIQRAEKSSHGRKSIKALLAGPHDAITFDGFQETKQSISVM